MMRLHIIQARFGDCFLLEYGEEAKPEYMLIDGGPDDNYYQNLKPALQELIRNGGGISDIVVSHVDNDHILGVVDFLTELQMQSDTGQKPFVAVDKLWFNSFNNTIATKNIAERIANVNRTAAANGVRMQEMSFALNGIKEGGQLMLRAKNLHLEVNKDSPEGFYLARKNNPIIKRENLDITVVGPTVDNLKKLQVEWEGWLRKNEQKIAEGKYTSDVAAALDRSVPNLSSIVLLVKANDKSILLTGDCRFDHLQQGLIETGLSVDGKYHVDILKVPHHGSMRNASKKFFEEVTADIYIISADGTYDNPDEETLSWIVEAAQDGRRKIKIIFTNRTPSTESLLRKYQPQFYEAQFMEQGKNFLTVS